MARGWNQSGFLNGNINTTLDPYYLCFLDENTPTVVRTNGLRTIDLTADLSAHLISGLETPCMLPRPAMVASRRGGSFLNGQRRDIPLSEPYVKGMIGLSPGTPADHSACLAAAALVTRIWIVTGGAYPKDTPGVWPYIGTTNTARFRNGAIFATTFTLKKQRDLERAALISGAMTAEFQYVGSLSILPPT